MGIIFSVINLAWTLGVVAIFLGIFLYVDCKWTHYICKNNKIEIPTKFPTNFPIYNKQDEEENYYKRMR
jgi:hypothetical protein